jgi:hypothetical protein
MKGVEVECATKFRLSRRKRRKDKRTYRPSASRRLTFTLTECYKIERDQASTYHL